MKNRSFAKICLSLTLMCLSALLFPARTEAQQAKGKTVRITGQVTDNQKNPLPGVTIVVVGTPQGTTTDVKGMFNITARVRDSLSFSYIGYQTRKIAVTDRTRYEVVLEVAATEMDEVVVVGYDVVRRKDLTGSVAAVRSEEIMKTGTVDFTRALQGRVAGVKVTTQSGEAGAGVDITIRGTNSLNAGTAPLYVIDGMQIDINSNEFAHSSVGGQTTYNPLASINPSDIASIDILKDASATAIYGARGANGVIIVTTKSGSSSKTDVSFNTYFGINRIAKTYDMLDGQGYVNYKFARGGSDMDVWGKDYGEGLVPRDVAKEGLGTYNWQDEMTRTGFMQNYDVSVNSVVKKTRISASLGYFDQKATINDNTFDRLSARLKLDQELGKKVNAGVSMTYGRVDTQGAISSGGTSGTSGYTGIVQLMYTERPVALYTPGEIAGEFANGYTPLSSMTSSETYKRTLFDRLLGNAYIQYRPIGDLTLRVNASLSNTYSKMSEFYSSKSRWGYSTDGRAGIQNINSTGYTVTATANYAKRINKVHRLTALLGAEINGYHYESSSMRVDQFDDQRTGVFDIGKGQIPQKPSSNVTQTNRASAFGRINYDYKGKYYVTANLRVDASSNFAKDARVGYFPSMALAWRVSEERFLKGAGAIDNLKIRASAGVTGNDRITAYSYPSVLGSTYYGENGAANFGLYTASSGNPGLKWETTYQYDLGLDLDLLKNRISLVADIYLKDTRDMLYNANVPAQSGFSRQWRNMGRMTNRGFELTLTTRNIVTKNFTWTTTLNFDTNKTQVISLGGEQFFPVSLNYGAFTDVGRVIVGEPIGLVYGYRYDGNYQVGDFVWTDKATGAQIDPSTITSENISRYNYTLKEGVVSYKGVTVAPGDRKYKDLTGEGTIDPNDREVIGDTNPKFNFGFGSQFTYKNFELGFFLDGSYGGKILNAFRRMIEGGANNYTNNMLAKVWENRWSPENPTDTYPGIMNKLDQQTSSYYVEDGSYLRIKNINIGYTFGRKYFGRTGIGSLKIYAILDNIYTFTNYSGLDPEVRSYEKFLRGMDQSAYPRTRNYMIGLTLTF